MRINPLDPVITGSDRLTANHTDPLKAILEEVIGEVLSADERKALRVARDAAVTRARERGAVATIHDVTRYLLEPDEEIVEAQLGRYGVDDYATWGRRVGFALEECIEGELAGLRYGVLGRLARVNAHESLRHLGSNVACDGAAELLKHVVHPRAKLLALMRFPGTDVQAAPTAAHQSCFLPQCRPFA